MMANEEIDYKLAAEQLRTGKPLFGKEGALAAGSNSVKRVSIQDSTASFLSGYLSVRYFS